MDFDRLPGGELVKQGIADLEAGRETEASLLVLVGSPRLSDLGIHIPATAPPLVEHRLYDLLARTDSDSAHSRYNALIRLLVSFERAAEMREIAGADRVRQLMRVLGSDAKREASVYFTDGATAVLMGWRSTTIDVDLAIIPDSDELLRALPEIKEKLNINVELASPAHFLPELPEWRERSVSIGKEGLVSFFHYDFYAQALAKIERGHAQDREDVRAMFDAGLIAPSRLVQLFEAIVPELYRFPAVDPASLRRAVEGVTAGGYEP